MTLAPSGEGLVKRVRVALAIVTALVFAMGLLGDFVWDDIQLIVSNAYVRDLSTLGTALTQPFWHTSNAWSAAGATAGSYYRPVVTLAYALEFHLFGQHAMGFHVVSLALHLACVLLVFGWLRRRLAQVAAHDLVTVAAGLGAALFALHPTRPESVTWISGSTDLWMGFWVLVGLAVWDRRRDAVGLALSGAALVLATLSKESAIVVPFVLLADALLLPWKGAERRSRAQSSVVLCGVVIAAFAMRFALRDIHPPQPVHDTLGDAVPRVLSSLGHYLVRVVWHVPPTMEVAPLRYDTLDHAVYPPWSVGLGAVGLSAMGVLSVAAWRKPGLRPWLADTLWFLAALAPVLNFVPLRLNVLIAPRFLYMPLLGVCAVVARAAALALGSTPQMQRMVRVLAVAVLGGASIVSLQHITHLLSDDDLWTYEYSLHPDNFVVVSGMAKVCSRERRYAESLAVLRRGIAEASAQHSRTYEILFTLTIAAEEVKQSSDANQAHLIALRTFLDAVAGPPGAVAVLDDGDPHLRLTLNPAERRWVTEDLADPYLLARAVAHARTLSFATAEGLLTAILRATPRLALAWRNLVLVYAAEQRWDDALAAADRAMRLLPDDTVVPMLRARIDRARRDVAALPVGSPERAIALANVFTDLGQRELARRTLAPVPQQAGSP